ncbi:hypothetical protein [Nocardia yunnanensis]|nr:hypothetical protein [Nocardia yunnanensis]
MQLMVVRHEVDGRVSEPMRATVLPIDALLSAAFVPVDSGEGR